jgi:uncharacterized protein with HEPN domain
MTGERLPVDYLEDILQASQKAIGFLGGASLADFESDDKSVFAVIRALEIIGVATKNVPLDVRDRYPSIPWRQMAGIRDKLSHDYLTVNVEVIWKTVTDDLPELIPAIRAVLTDLAGQ